MGKRPRGNTVEKSHAKPAAPKTPPRKQPVRARAAEEEKQLVVGSAAKEEKGAKQLVMACAEKRVENQQVVAHADKEKKGVREKQPVEPRVDVQAEVQMSYERYLQIGYKELERLTLENYSLSGSAKFRFFQ